MKVILACMVIRTVIIDIEIIKLLEITIIIVIVIMIFDNSNLYDIMKMMESWKERNGIWNV